MYATVSDYLNTENYEESSIDLSNPKVWGPSFWFNLHVSSFYYPEKASPLVAKHIKNRILAIPYEIVCHNCRAHAAEFIRKNEYRLDEIVSGREELSKFYVDFHNVVNKRYKKPEWSYEKAKEFYTGKSKVVMRYS